MLTTKGNTMNTTLEGKQNRCKDLMDEMSVKTFEEKAYAAETSNTLTYRNIQHCIAVGILPDRRRSIQSNRVAFERLS